jgi:hypothetical protein
MSIEHPPQRIQKLKRLERLLEWDCLKIALSPDSSGHSTTLNMVTFIVSFAFDTLKAQFYVRVVIHGTPISIGGDEGTFRGKD